MYLLNELTSKYATDARIANVVDTREIWIIPSINPDGAEFDVATGSYALWRKNRQPNAGSTAVGTDLNRNWGFQWGCCGGSSGTFSSETYRGAAPFSAPETQVVRDFVQSRRHRRRAADQDRDRLPHATPSSILWPYGYTTADTTPTMTADVRNTFATLGQNMAARTATRPSRPRTCTSPTARSTTGCGATRASSATRSRCTRARSSPGFYPPDEVIPAQTARNREAVLRLLETSDCPYRAIGKETQYCGIASTTVFSDDFETNKGWTSTARPTPRRSGAGSAATRRRRPPAAPSSSARRSAASTTSSRAGWPAPRRATTTSTAA